MSRRVYYRPEFDEDADQLGGVATIQKIIAPVVQTLEDGDPSGFGLLDTTTGIRYARTVAVGNMAPLVITFRVDDEDDVEMLSISLAGHI